MDPSCHFLGHGEETVAFILTLDAINFGSGYFPEVVPPGRSGYFVVAGALHDFFHRHGPLSAGELASLTVSDCADIFHSLPDNLPARELLALFTRALNDLGRFLLDHFDGGFAAAVSAAGGSAENLISLLASMPFFQDVATYQGREIGFFKRAQITVADLFIAFSGEGPGRFDDIDRLTLFADNLVPHVLRLDGLLHSREDLAARIGRGEFLPSGCSEEIEIRSCALHAVELLVDELRSCGHEVNALILDNLLWHRGQGAVYRSQPRHRTKTVFY
jgi:hypothetical protein